MFARHPNQGRRAWLLQSSWVVLEQDTLTCCHPGWKASGWTIFSELANMFLLNQGSDQKTLAKTRDRQRVCTIKLFSDTD